MTIPLWLISLVIGLIAGFIVAGVLKAQLKSVHRQPGASSYVIPGGLKLTVRTDTFLYERTTQTPRHQEDNND